MNPVVDVIFLLLQFLKFAILGRVLLSWVDPNPYPTNVFKRGLWAVTDPILEPLRRIIPPMGMFDISPIVAIVVLDVVARAIHQSFAY